MKSHAPLATLILHFALFFSLDLRAQSPSIDDLARQAGDGSSDAASRLGTRYYFGIQGAPQDFQKSAEWFRLAAELGNSGSQAFLSAMYEKGQGVPQNYNEAAKWLRRAAEQGLSVAQLNLARMYYEGKGVLQDYLLTHMWANLSLATSSDIERRNSEEALANVASKMTPAQIAQAQEMARKCLDSNYKNCD